MSRNGTPATQDATLEALEKLAASESEAATVYNEAPALAARSTYKNVHEFIVALNAQTGETINRQAVIDELSNILSRPANGTAGSQRRGQLLGLTLSSMTDEQLKREKINADSVLYKAKQRGAAAETIAKNQERVDAVIAEKASRVPAPTVAPVTAQTQAEAAIAAEV